MPHNPWGGKPPKKPMKKSRQKRSVAGKRDLQVLIGSVVLAVTMLGSFALSVIFEFFYLPLIVLGLWIVVVIIWIIYMDVKNRDQKK